MNIKINSFYFLFCLFFSSLIFPYSYGEIFLLEAPGDMAFRIWEDELNSKGIILAHSFPPAGGILILDYDYTPNINEAIEISGTKVYIDLPYGEDEKRICSTQEGNILYNVFKRFLGLQEIKEEFPEKLGAPLINDFFIPEIDKAENFGSCSSPYLKYSGSEYLLGKVSVNVILPESNGAIDPSTENWNSTLETTVITEIIEGLDELRNLYTNTASLKPVFTYHNFFGRTDTRAQTSYEPINRNAAPSYNNCTTGEGLWACEILNKLGYSAFSGYTKALEFNGNTRNADGTDWAFTIFVANSVADADGRFLDSHFAYAWVGGPWIVMTYDNDNWGISNMNKVVKHETGHIFYADDEYSVSGCTCTHNSGYINYQDQNCQNSCSSNVSCMMRDNVNSTCYYTKGQTGWGDLDSDSIPDPVDIAPQTTLTPYSPDPTTNTNLTFNGTSTIQKNPNQNYYGYRCDINILKIANVQYRVNSGSWNSATPSDGSFNSSEENYTFTIGPLTPGTYTIETRAVDGAGQADSSYASDTVTVILSGPPGVQNGQTGTPMRATKITSSGSQIYLTWDNSCAGENYSIVTGPGSGLPSSYSGIYTVSSSSGYCSMGNVSSFTWSNSIDPNLDPKKFYWFLIVSTNSTRTTEGSWGKNTGGVERTGPGSSGSSGQCSVSSKSLTNTCGQ